MIQKTIEDASWKDEHGDLWDGPKVMRTGEKITTKEELIQYFAGEKIGLAAAEAVSYAGETGSTIAKVACEAFGKDIPKAAERVLCQSAERGGYVWKAVDGVGDGLWARVREATGETAWDAIGVIGLAYGVAMAEAGYLTVADLLDFPSPWTPMLDIWRMGCWPMDDYSGSVKDKKEFPHARGVCFRIFVPSSQL